MWEGRDSPEQTWDPYLRINLLDHSPGVAYPGCFWSKNILSFRLLCIFVTSS